VKEVLCDIAPTNSCHLLLRWSWLHFKMHNLDERFLYLSNEGHEMKLKFMTPRGSREKGCLIEGHPCLVAFVYESNINVVSQRLVEKFQLPTSFHPNQARMKFTRGQCVKEVLCDISLTNSRHLLLRWAWLNFKMLNLDERFLYLSNEGHEMKLKFMTPRQASKDQRRLK